MNEHVNTFENLGFLLRVAPSTTPVEVVREALGIVTFARLYFEERGPAGWDRGHAASNGPERHPIECAPDQTAKRYSIYGALYRTSGLKFGRVPANSPLDIAIRGVAHFAADYAEAKGIACGLVSLTYFNDYVADMADVIAVLRLTERGMENWIKARGA